MALAHALTENSTLQKLVVSDNYVGALGAGALATAIGRNTGLTDLRLKGCELGDSVLERLCDALSVRPRLADDSTPALARVNLSAVDVRGWCSAWHRTLGEQRKPAASGKRPRMRQYAAPAACGQ